MESQRVEISLTISAPVERVWAVLTDIDRLPDVSPSITSVEHVTGDGYVVGARWRQTRSVLGREDTNLLTVVELDRPHRLVADATMGEVDYTLTGILEPADEGTRLTMTYDPVNPDASPVEVLLRHMARPLSGWLHESALQREMAAIRAAVEGTASGGPADEAPVAVRPTAG